jgi:NagD protein
MEAGLEPYLALIGVTTRDELARYPFRPTHIVDSIADIVEQV